MSTCKALYYYLKDSPRLVKWKSYTPDEGLCAAARIGEISLVRLYISKGAKKFDDALFDVEDVSVAKLLMSKLESKPLERHPLCRHFDRVFQLSLGGVGRLGVLELFLSKGLKTVLCLGVLSEEDDREQIVDLICLCVLSCSIQSELEDKHKEAPVTLLRICYEIHREYGLWTGRLTYAYHRDLGLIFWRCFLDVKKEEYFLYLEEEFSGCSESTSVAVSLPRLCEEQASTLTKLAELSGLTQDQIVRLDYPKERLDKDCVLTCFSDFGQKLAVILGTDWLRVLSFLIKRQ